MKRKSDDLKKGLTQSVPHTINIEAIIVKHLFLWVYLLTTAHRLMYIFIIVKHTRGFLIRFYSACESQLNWISFLQKQIEVLLYILGVASVIIKSHNMEYLAMRTGNHILLFLYFLHLS